jgi:outer membrane protein assembly factor BamB
VTTLRRVLGVGALTVLLAACWPTPGAGPDRRSHNPFERTLTADRVAGLTEAFRVPLEEGAGAPVVTTAGLFVRTARSIAAFEPRTGAARWSVRVPAWDGGEEDSFWHTVSDPYVLDDGRRVLATVTTYAPGGFHGSELVSLRADTGVAERRPASGGLQSLRGSRVATYVHNYPQGIEHSILGTLDLDDGTTWGGWTFETGGSVVGSLGADRLYLATGATTLAYDTTTPCPSETEEDPFRVCQASWIRPLDGAATAVVIGDDDTVHVGGGSALVALDAGTGAERWRFDAGAGVTRAPALADGVLYAATADGRLSAMPAGGCGAPSCPASWTTATGGAPSVQPVVAGGVVYVGSADGTIRAFDAAGCGAPTCPALWTVDAGAPVTGGLAVYGGRLYAGTGEGLVAYGLPPA